jgi:flotillin
MFAVILSTTVISVMVGILVVFAAIMAVVIPMMFRVVVDTNTVHTVQSKSKTISFGAKQASGNVYYRWPSWFPLIGVKSIVLPVSNFEKILHGYKAYDKERVPFELDLVAFFVISDTNKAAEKITDFKKLDSQLEFIMQGAVRKILASHDINQIMTDRATFGEQFTKEVEQELANWGVQPVKNMELMDIRDADGSKVITNIMAKKSSHIEMESRIEVAKNSMTAQTAEIEAKRQIEVSRQTAEQQIGQSIADKDKAIGIAEQRAQQEIESEKATTTQKLMDVKRVEQIQQAEIDREAALVKAEQGKAVAIMGAEAQLEATKLKAEGVKKEGEANAAAQEAMLLAPVKAQITLAEEIGSNVGYQQYLVSLESVKAYVVVGSEQAKALQNADVKVIANTGNPTEGVKSAMQLLTPQGGLSIGGMLEALSNTPQGSAILENVGNLLSSQTPATKPVVKKDKA